MLKRINVDTTVQEKEVRFPTDSRLYDRARQRLVDEAKNRIMSLWILVIAVTAAKVAYRSMWINGAGVEQSRAYALDETTSCPIEAGIGHLKR